MNLLANKSTMGGFDAYHNFRIFKPFKMTCVSIVLKIYHVKIWFTQITVCVKSLLSVNTSVDAFQYISHSFVSAAIFDRMGIQSCLLYGGRCFIISLC